MSRQPPSDDDESLVRRCLDGDGSAWGVLVQRYQRLVYAIARRGGLDEDDAADVLQTVFLKLIQSLTRLSAPAKLQAWIVTTSKREVINRRRNAEPTVALDERNGDGSSNWNDEPEAWRVADEADGPEATVEHWQRVMRVRRALDALDGPCRRLLLALFGGDSPGYDDVARLLDMPIGSIGPTRARCLEKLRRVLEDDT